MTPAQFISWAHSRLHFVHQEAESKPHMLSLTSLENILRDMETLPDELKDLSDSDKVKAYEAFINNFNSLRLRN